MVGSKLSAMKPVVPKIFSGEAYFRESQKHGVMSEILPGGEHKESGLLVAGSVSTRSVGLE